MLSRDLRLLRVVLLSLACYMILQVVSEMTVVVGCAIPHLASDDGGAEQVVLSDRAVASDESKALVLPDSCGPTFHHYDLSSPSWAPEDEYFRTPWYWSTVDLSTDPIYVTALLSDGTHIVSMEKTQISRGESGFSTYGGRLGVEVFDDRTLFEWLRVYADLLSLQHDAETGRIAMFPVSHEVASLTTIRQRLHAALQSICFLRCGDKFKGSSFREVLCEPVLRDSEYARDVLQREQERLQHLSLSSLSHDLLKLL